MFKKSQAIEIKDLSVGYSIGKKTKVVAKGLNAVIQPGELTCLIGANGVGKSTLLRTLSAFQPKLGGEILILGQQIESYDNKALARTIGVVLTEKVDVRDMTVRDLVGMGRSPYTGFWGKLNEEDREWVEKSIDAVGIQNLAGRPIQSLSDGERQKVMIAKALAQQTPLIILDEPTAFLDYPSKVDVMKLLHELTRSSGMTIFLSTHDLELALQLSDKLWLMDRERGVEVGSTSELSEKGQLSSFFQNKSIIFDTKTQLYRIVK